MTCANAPLLADLIPTPKSIVFDTGTCRLSAQSRIFIPVGAPDAQQRTAAALAATLKSYLNIRPAIVETTRYVNHAVLYVAADEQFNLPHDLLPHLTPEAYALRIDRRGLLLAAHDQAGLFYAVQTLDQVLRLRCRSGATVPNLTIRDWPDLACRALMMDVGRQAETPDYLDSYITRLAALKKNMFVLYFENRFAWKSHPEAAAEISYTADDFRRFDATAAANHMDFVPALASLGHCEGMLRNERYRHLREEGAIYQLTLRDDRTRDFLTDLYGEILPTYRSRYFHANCDESPLLAGPPGAPKSHMRESLKLFAGHLIFLHDLLARSGKQMMVWGDMLLEHPEIAADLPRDIIIVDWDYGDMTKRQRQAPQQLRDMGFPVIVAPAAGRSAEVAFAPLMQMTANIPPYLRQARDLKLMGEMTTIWEMFSTNPIVTWPGVVASAQYAWNCDAIPPTEIAARVAAHLHGPAAASDVAQAYAHLSADGFMDHYRQLATKPEIPHCRTYHLDSHEFLPTDPFVYLTYRPTPWAEEISRTAAQGLTDVLAAKRSAVWNQADLLAYEVAGLHQFLMGEKRRAVNAAGRYVVDAEIQRRQGHLDNAAALLSEAIENLEQLQSLVIMLLDATPQIWRQTRHANDPAIDDIYMRRLRLSRDSLRRNIKRLTAAQAALSEGRNHDLSTIIGGQQAIFIAVRNPDRNLVEIVKPHIEASDDGKNWRDLWRRNLFMLENMDYAAALMPGTTLPRLLRLRVTRSQINQAAWPLHERLAMAVVRTLTPAEIIDASASAGGAAGAGGAGIKVDFDVQDHRLVRVPTLTYKLTHHQDWTMQFELQEVPDSGPLPFIGRR